MPLLTGVYEHCQPGLIPGLFIHPAYTPLLTGVYEHCTPTFPFDVVVHWLSSMAFDYWLLYIYYQLATTKQYNLTQSRFENPLPESI